MRRGCFQAFCWFIVLVILCQPWFWQGVKAFLMWIGVYHE